MVIIYRPAEAIAIVDLQPGLVPGITEWTLHDSSLGQGFYRLATRSSITTWAGHLVHVALPASRGQSTDWSNLLHQLPHPAGLKPFITLEWGLYSTNGDQWNHVFGLADASVRDECVKLPGH
jgi:photosystem I P700 chlorophyll a apoprotein A2